MKNTTFKKALIASALASIASYAFADSNDHSQKYAYGKKTSSPFNITLPTHHQSSSLLPHHFNKKHNQEKYFKRIATFPIYKNLDESIGDTLEDTTSAEISAASSDGHVVFYSDSPQERIGLIDIKRPKNPKPAGFIQLDGEPTSVAVRGHYLLVAVNTSQNFTQPSGKLSIYSIADPLSPVWISDFNLQGQPDAIAVSPDKKYAAIVIENERDEDLNDGLIPQLPAGHLMVLSMRGPQSKWKIKKIDLTGYADIAPSDPEPEYVAINRANIAAISLQENNHIILVDLRSGKVIQDFSAGTADLFDVDLQEDDIINPVEALLEQRREPDAITWVNDWWIATANEGDYEDENGIGGGSRGFTIFNMQGGVSYESGASFEHELIRAGHYPESRSENKGIEPEAVIADRYGDNRWNRKNFLFVGSERGNVIGVYEAKPFHQPKLHQLLPTTVAPEGILTIPSRNLLIVSSEEDSAEDGIRSTVSIYRYGAKKSLYPQIQSDNQQLIPWGALSGMVGDVQKAKTLYAVPDSYYKQSRIFTIDAKTKPATITAATVLKKDNDTVNYDLEGIAQREDGSFWLVSEGDGKDTPNLLILASQDGTIQQEIQLPIEVSTHQKKNGFEGVAVIGNSANETVFVAFQREWKNDPDGLVRIGVYSPSTEQWAFLYYPLESAVDGTWNGLSEITRIDDKTLAVIERDNQQGEAATIKRLYQFSIDGLTAVAEGNEIPVVNKQLVIDLLPELQKTNGRVLDKVEGTAIITNGNVYIVTDNDGVDDASGETRFIKLGKLFQ
ncbi:MAG: esterase-like activity of phytase family protein [Cellvibrionaceae bacterium]